MLTANASRWYRHPRQSHYERIDQKDAAEASSLRKPGACHKRPLNGTLRAMQWAR
jgi:hypothetical protein